MPTKLLIGMVIAGLLAACGNSGEEGPLLPDASVVAEPEDAGYLDPGLTVDAGSPYPAQPWGVEPGDTIKDLSFYGYRLDLSETAPWNVVKLSDFYDPQGDRGVGGTPTKALWINVAALWCGACRQEAPVMRQLCEDNRAKGLVCLTAIYENGGYGPSVRNDVNSWLRDFEIDYALVNDPTFKFGGFFDRAATPLNMFVDLETMKIVHKFTGFTPAAADEAIADMLR